MFKKICILLWKEKNYRAIHWTLLGIICSVLIVILVNLNVELATGCRDNSVPRSVRIPSNVPKIDQCQSSGGVEARNFAYEPENEFLENLVKDAFCLDHNIESPYRVKAGFTGDIAFGVKFSGFDPKFLDYTMFPTKYKSSFPSKLWIYSGSLSSESTVLRQRYSSWGSDPSAVKFQQNLNLIFRDKIQAHSVDVTVDVQNSYFAGPECQILSFIIPVVPILLFVWENSKYLMILVEEKKSGLKLYLQVMGFTETQLKLSGFIFPLCIHTAVVSLATFFFYYPLTKESVVFKHVHPGFIFCHLLLSAINLTIFQYFLSVFFLNEAYASAVSFFLMALPPISLLGTFDNFININPLINRITCLVPSLCLSKGFILLLDFESYGKNVKWFEKLDPLGVSLTITDFFLMNVVDIVVYYILRVYLGKVIPGNLGITLPYFVKKRCWKSKGGALESRNQDAVTEVNKETFEKVPSNLKVAISVKNLSKTYKSGVVALNDVSIDFYEGEIVGLLGHNGAGKTTLFSILCGMTSASKGSVNVGGYDIRNSRKNLGYCPQHDILVNASVIQNIVFFAMAKGLNREEAEKEADSIITRLGLDQSRHVRAPKLSKGQKRKLSLAVAISGNPQVVLLDEPTTGIDAVMRREIWNIILEFRGSKTVILSTHLLEEADALCNRVAVLSQGRIHSYGTPLFLKSKYGTGFALSIVTADTNKANFVKDLVAKFVKTAEFKYQNKLTLVFKLPEKEISNFPALFELLDEKKKGGEIVFYSITVATMEDVILNIDSDDSQRKIVAEDKDEGLKNEKGSGLFVALQALLVKKCTFFRRNLMLHLVAFGLILFLHSIFLYVLSEGGKRNNVTFSLSLYGEPEVLYMTDTGGNCLVDSFKKIISKSGATFRQVDDITKELLNLRGENFVKFSKSLLAIEFLEKEIKILYNRNAEFALPITIDLVFNAFLSANNSFVRTSLSYELLKSRQVWEPFLHKKSKAIEECPFIILHFLFLPLLERYLFLILPLEEKKTEVKTLQLLYVSPVTYWASHLIFDLPILIVYSVIRLMVIGVINEDLQKVMMDHIGAFSISFVLYCIAMLLTMYALSTLFNNYWSSSLVDLIIFFATMLALSQKQVFAIVKYISPTALWFTQLLEICYPDYIPGWPIMRLGIYSIVVLVILILIDTGILRKIFHKSLTYLFCYLKIVRFDYKHPKDDTVENEKTAVKDIIKNKQLATKTLVVNSLKRWYCSCAWKNCVCCKIGCIKSAVKGVSFAVDKGECFGLVGTNGAGKTTIFGILTGSLIPSLGSAYVESRNLSNCFLKHKAFSRLGYCPQFSCVLPKFKGKEMLQLFARLKGCSGSLLEKEVKKWISLTNLHGYENKNCDTYSGGNKRKLSIAIAFIGNSFLALLDEPTEGIDASSRRMIWDLISCFREKGKSIMLTSQSMEECEALCSRMSIMTNGQMRVIGETTKLKSVYGQGYTVLLKLNFNATDDQRAKLQNAMEKIFGDGCKLTDSHLTLLQYEITKEKATWKKLFAELNTIKSKYAFLESFYASSTTLEQVFMNLSKG